MVDYKSVQSDFLGRLRLKDRLPEHADEVGPATSDESVARQIAALEQAFTQIPDLIPQFASDGSIYLMAESVYRRYDAVSIIVSLPYSQGRPEMTESISVGTAKYLPLGQTVYSPTVQIGFVQVNGARVHRSMKMGWQQMLPPGSPGIVEKQLAELRAASNKAADLLTEKKTPADIIFGL